VGNKLSAVDPELGIYFGSVSSFSEIKNFGKNIKKFAKGIC
jgi:hypothetical protein